MKKSFLYILFALVASLGLASCSDDEAAKSQLGTPSLTQGATTVSSLAFSWEAVEGATQYGYELYDASGNVVLGDVTSTTSVIATGLAANSTYTLKVWAYAAYTGNKSTSPIAEITATTSQIVPLDEPVPEASSANGGVTIVWPAVEHASSYTYSYEVDGETIMGSTTTNSVTLTGLAIGTYTIYITAVSDDEAYSDSKTISLTFERTKAEVWRKTGWHWSAGLQQYSEADMVAYDDGSYSIVAPYGEENYKIDFTVNDDHTINILNHYAESSGYYYVSVSSQYYLAAYTASWGSNSYSSATIEDDSIDVWFASYLYDTSDKQIGNFGYDEFIWTPEETVEWKTVAENANFYFQNYATMPTFYGNIEQYGDENRFRFKNFMGSGADWEFSIDETGGTNDPTLAYTNVSGDVSTWKGYLTMSADNIIEYNGWQYFSPDPANEVYGWKMDGVANSYASLAFYPGYSYIDFSQSYFYTWAYGYLEDATEASGYFYGYWGN